MTDWDITGEDGEDEDGIDLSGLDGASDEVPVVGRKGGRKRIAAYAEDEHETGDDGLEYRSRRGKVAGGPRDVAARIVRGVLEGRGLARTHLAAAAERVPAGARSAQGLLTELVYGTVRRAATVDAVLDAVAKGGVGQVDDPVLANLRVAAYQLLFLDNIPAAVAVNEAVAAIPVPHIRSFANGVLRTVSRIVTRRVEGDDPPRGVPSTRRCLGRDGGWVVLERDLFPDAARDPAAWLAAAASFPRATCAAWVERHGLEGAIALARAQDSPPPIALRTNLRKITREALLERLKANGVPAAAPGGPPESIRLGASFPPAARAVVEEGLATVQDETAMRVATFLGPQKGERIVDLCAAPGGKATHLAERMDDQGRVDALDIHPKRLAKVEAAAKRLGLTCVRTGQAEAPLTDAPGDGGPPVDRVLADVPCSNTGVLRRRVEARWRLDQVDWRALDALQARLLERAVDLVRPGGVVVYSTCAIEPRENQERVKALLAKRPDVTLDQEHAAAPERGGGDGGYMAKLLRKA